MHTPGMLTVSDLGPDQIWTTGDNAIRLAQVIHSRNHDRQEDARRLVACWNACEGIDTETLEAMRLGDMRLDFAPKLVEMLGMMIWYYESFRDKSPVGPTERDDVAMARKLLADARAT